MGSLWQRGLFALMIASPCLTAPTSAHGQDQNAAVEALIRRGLDLRRRGHDDQAFQAFESAWSVAHSPRARAQMALAAQALGRWADADHFLRDALAATGDAWITDRRAVLEQSLTQIDAHLGLLEVTCNTPGAVVRVDGTPRGTTPLSEPLRLPAGTVTLQIGAPGYLEVTRQAVLTTGATTREQINLVAVPSVATPQNPPSGGSQTQQGPGHGATSNTALHGVLRPPDLHPPPPPPPPPDGASVQRTFAWTSGGLALAGLATGAVFLVLRNSAATEFNGRNTDTILTNDCPTNSIRPACVDAEETIASRGTLSTVGFVVGGAAAVASTLLFATLPSRGSRVQGAFRGCAIAPERGSAGVSCTLAF